MATKNKRKTKAQGGPLDPDRYRGPYAGSRATRDKSPIETIVENIHSKKPPATKITKLEPKSVETKIKKVEKKEMKPMPEKKKKKKSFWSQFKPISVKEARKRERRDQYKTSSPTTSDVAQEVVSVNPISKNIKKKDIEEKTKKGGDFPVMKKESVSAQSFRDAFNAARNPKSGKRGKAFTWQGRSYSTRQAGEGKWNAETGKWGKAAKKQMGGPIEQPFKQGIKYYKGGGQVTTSNNKAASGDIVNVHSHSGYKAGK